MAAAMPSLPFKVPQSVLVVIYSDALDVLLIRRADSEEDFWQSVTGSKDAFDELYHDTAAREVLEETGINSQAAGCELSDWGLENVYDIYPRWLWRYEPGVTRNVEHVFGLRVPADTVVRLNPREHTQFGWWPWREAADRCYSPSNAEACLWVPRMAAAHS
jgi:dATP pyrophosphohydrolase